MSIIKEHYMDKLNDHKHKKGIFKSPINQIESDIEKVSWRIRVHPDLIWISLIFYEFGRDNTLLILSNILKKFKDNKLELNSLNLSEIFSLDEFNQKLIYDIISEEIGLDILSVLTVVFKKDKYPTFYNYFFVRNISVEEKINILKEVLDIYGAPKSNEATDIQFITIWFYIINGKFHIINGLDEVANALSTYHKLNHSHEDMRVYRPIIRSIFLSPMCINDDNVEFIDCFWKELRLNSGCDLMSIQFNNDFKLPLNFIKDVQKEFNILIASDKYSLLEDSKFNVIMGSGVYSLKILNEIVESNLQNKIMGRLSLRIIIEVYIMLKYLLKNEEKNKNIWNDYQEYGIGKYKMILLKARENYDNGFSNSHLDNELVELLVNEYQDEMFINVDFRNFDNEKIRDKAIKVDEKELYDIYYDYESNYAHGLWGAIRESSLLKCSNPLHLYHNVPDVNFEQNLSDVLPDAYKVMKKLLFFIHNTYPLSEEFINEYEVNDERL